MTLASLRVSAAVETGATSRFPFGKEALVPLTVAAQGLSLLAVCVYAAVGSVRTLLDGGVDLAPESVAAYAAISGAGSLALFLVLRRAQGGSDLVGAEVRQWWASTLFSTVVLVGSLVALVLAAVGADLDRYVDPTLVLIACLLLVREPVAMLRSGVGELIESSAPDNIQEAVGDVIEAVRHDHGLDEPGLRVGKVGRKVYVEADFVVRPGEWDVADEDAVRRAVSAGLAALPYDMWLNVELTTYPDTSG